MKAYDFLQWLHIAEKMKCQFRHSFTTCGRKESVAEHSYRLILMAYILKEKLPQVDMDKVIEMAIIHDLGEAVMGDIPSFLKTKKDEKLEEEAFSDFTKNLPAQVRENIGLLYEEMNKMESLEAKVFKALDKMEAVIQHNEADISTWLDIEYQLQLDYGVEEAQVHDYLKELRQIVLKESQNKIEKATEEKNK